MGMLATLWVTLGLKKEGFDRGAKESKDKIKEVGTEAQKTGDKVEDVGKKGTKSFGPAMLLGAVVAVFVAVKQLWAGMKDLYNSFGESERASNSLAQALRNNGKDVDVNIRKYDEFAEQMMKLTNTDDELVLSLLTLAENLRAADPMQAVKGAIALSKAYGIELTQGVKMATLAESGNFTMLSRQIVALRTATTASEQLAIYQQAVAGGFKIATSEAKDSLGVTERLKNAWGNLKEVFGGVIAAPMKSFFEGLSEWLEDVTMILNTKSIPAFERFLAAVTGINSDYVRNAAYADKKNQQLFEEKVKRLKLEGAAEQDFTKLTDDELQKRLTATKETADAQNAALEFLLNPPKKSFAEKAFTADPAKILMQEATTLVAREAKKVTEIDRARVQASLELLSEETSRRKQEADKQLEAEVAKQEKLDEIRGKEAAGLQDLIDGLAAYVKGSENYYNQLIAINDKRIKNLTGGEIRDSLIAENQELKNQIYLLGVSAEKRAEMQSQSVVPEKMQAAGTKTSVTGGVGSRTVTMTMSDELKEQGEKIKETYEKMVSDAQDFSSRISDTINSGVVGAFQAMAQSIGESGKIDLGTMVAAILNPLGDMAITTGVLALGIGKAVAGIKASLLTLSPVAAIAAGAALIALGVAAKAGAAAIAGSGGGGGGYGGGQTSVSGSMYREGTQKVEVVGVIKKGDIYLSNQKETLRRAR